MSELPKCPECDAKVSEVGPRFAIDGKLSHLSVKDAADQYYADPSDYDSTTVVKFACGNIVPEKEIGV